LISHISGASVLASTIETESAGTGIVVFSSFIASVTTLLGRDVTKESNGGQGNNEDLSPFTF
jgi:hypothetical protein